MHMPMNELALSQDKSCEARRIRLVDRDDPHFRQSANREWPNGTVYKSLLALHWTRITPQRNPSLLPIVMIPVDRSLLV